MAYLLFLTGDRVDDAVELNPAATLTLGSSPKAHIQLPDSDVAATHGRVYPAQGSYWFQDLGQGYTFLNLEPLANATHALNPHDVLIVGRTFMKFVTEKPRASAGGGATEELRALKADVKAAQDELEASKEELKGATERLKTLEDELKASKFELKASTEELKTAQVELKAAKIEVKASKKELSTRKMELGRLREKLSTSEGAAKQAQKELDEMRAKLEEASAKGSQSPDPSRAPPPNKELAKRKREIDRLRERLTASQGAAQKGERELERVRSDFDRARAELERVRAELEEIRTAQRNASRKPPKRLSELVFERGEERTQIEVELRSLRGRASTLSAALVVGKSGA